MFADIHSHVLCGIDDGARDLQESRQLLGELNSVGVTHIALTPHYYPYRRSIASFREQREEAYQALLTLPEAKRFTFSLGAEVYLTETLFNNADLASLCYEGTNFMLTELEYSDYFTASARLRLLRLTEDYGIVPVLAHIDRYPFLWKDSERLLWLRGIGCLFQVNLSALTGVFSRQRALRLWDQGKIDFFGEDVHHSVISGKMRKKMTAFLEKKRPNLTRKASERAAELLFSRS